MKQPLLLAGAVVSLATAPEAQVAPKAIGFQSEYIAELNVAEDHVVRLAQAIPADKYTWRPAPGVRSISEVLLHIASSHNNIPRVLGV
ncbi:MAG: DinB family protein, partial [Gemmatimonadaceae bacterium]